MEQNEEIKQDTQYLFYRVAEDSTRWDRMTGVELKKRIKTLLADDKSFEKMVDVISCLRLAQVFYLRTKNKKECAIPFIVTPQGEMLLLFTAKSQIKNEQYKQYAVESTTYPALIKSLSAAINSVIMREYTRLRKSEQSLLFFVNNLSHLTAAERDLVRLLLQGKKVQEIAAARVVEVVTVKTQIKGLLHKFGCSRTKEVVQMIRDLNLEHLFM